MQLKFNTKDLKQASVFVSENARLYGKIVAQKRLEEEVEKLEMKGHFIVETEIKDRILSATRGLLINILYVPEGKYKYE